MRVIREIVTFFRALNKLFPPLPIPRPPEVRIGHRRYWDDAEWDAYRDKVLKGRLP
jgi:hypothetical protein